MTKLKPLLICCTALVLSGCATLFTTPDMSPMYQPLVRTRDDINGTVTSTYVPLYRVNTLSDTETFAIMSISQLGRTTYYAYVTCTYSSWRFIDTIQLRTDHKLYALKDSDPYRSVLSGGKVAEALMIRLTDEILADLKKTDSLIVQYSGKPNTIPSQGIVAMRAFLP